MDIDRCAEIGTEVAREAGKLLLEQLHSNFAVTHKGEINLVTEVDFAAEELIVGRLRAAFPGCAIVAEEKHAQGVRGPLTWIIDPLDGTTNYAHRFPMFSVSIGLEIDGQQEWGAVYAPAQDEMFTARRGGGAACNGRPTHVSKIASLKNALLVTGFPYDIRTSPVNNLEEFRAFALSAQAIRRTGSAAMDLCYVAAGRFDGFWELKLQPWDCAAGYLIVREAGGTVTNLRGEPGTIYDGEVVASNALIHDQMLSVLKRKTE
jgi:myo-inositol-1(or 4)-monophosphatase